MREEGKELVKLFCWNRQGLRANHEQGYDGTSKKKISYHFLRGFITGCRDSGMLGVLFTETNATWR